jgi:hypothetical protein
MSIIMAYSSIGRPQLNPRAACRKGSRPPESTCADRQLLGAPRPSRACPAIDQVNERRLGDTVGEEGYPELVPAGGDNTSTLLKIFNRIRNDCELAGKAFSRKCTITQVNIYSNPNTTAEMAGATMVNASATLMLLPGAAGTSPPPSAK